MADPVSPAAEAVVVSGRFEGAMAAPKPGSEVLELRLDIDSRAPSVSTNRLSGDFFAVNTVNLPGAPPRVWRVYRESWVVDAPNMIQDVVTEALRRGGPAVIEVRVDPQVCPPLGERARSLSGFIES